MADKQVTVKLVAQTAAYTKGMNEASTSTRKLGSDIDKTGAQSKGFASTTGQAVSALKGMAAAGAAVAGTALVAFLSDSVRAAGDLQQSIGGVDSVFGDMADQIHAFGENSAEAVGLSRNAFNELITVTGALLKNKGLEDFTQKSLDLVQIGADLAATFGGSTAQAVEALNAAMRGEADPIERYGISLNMAAVNAELAAKGLTGLKGAALEQAQAQARLDIIARQSADALGQFAREADTLQGQQQRLNAKWEDAKASLGTALLPALTQVVSMMSEGVDAAVALGSAMGSVPQPVWAAAAALAAVHLAGPKVAAAAASVRVTMSAAAEAMSYASAASARAGGGFAGAAVGLRTFTGSASLASSAASGLATAGRGMLALVGGPWGLAFIGAAVAVGKFMQSQSEAKARVDELRSSLDAQTGAVTENTVALVAKRLADEGLLEVASRLGLEHGVLTNAILGEAGAIAEVNRVTEEAIRLDGHSAMGTGERTMSAQKLQNALGDLGGEVQEATRGHAELKAEVDAAAASEEVAADAATAAAVAQGELADQTQDAADAAEEAKKALDKYIDSLTTAGMLTLDTRAATRSYREALDEAREAAKEATKEGLSQAEMFDVNTEAGRKNQAVLDDQARSAEALAQAIYEETGSEAMFRQSLEQSRDELAETARQFGMNEAQAESYANQILGIPKTAYTTITSNADVERLKVEAFRRAMANLTGKHIVVTTSFSGPGASYIGRGQTGLHAAGGYITGPGTGTSDSIPAWLSNGEYVVKAAAVEKYGVNFLHAVNAMRFASGGSVSRNAAPASSAPSLSGMRIEGVLDTPFGPSAVRGVVRSELDKVGRTLGGY